MCVCEVTFWQISLLLICFVWKCPLIEAERQEQINKASGEANAMLAVADARARGILTIAKSLQDMVSKRISANIKMSMDGSEFIH